MQGRTKSSSAVLALALGIVACGGNTNPVRDSGAPPVPELDPLAAYEQTSTAYVETTLDYSCLGTLTEPTGGDRVSTTFELRDFQNGFTVDDTEVWLFDDNQIADTCDPPFCQSVTTNANGDAVASLPASGWIAYRVLPKMGLSRMTTVFGVFQYNFAIPATAGGSVTGNSVSGSTIDLIPATLGISRTPGLALVAGRIRDCGGASVENAIVRLYDPSGAPVLEGERTEDPHFHYFSGEVMRNLPNVNQRDTNTDGLFVLIQIPPADGEFRLEAWGNLDGEPTLIGCETARIFEDAVTIMNLNPTRADGPAACR